MKEIGNFYKNHYSTVLWITQYNLAILSVHGINYKPTVTLSYSSGGRENCMHPTPLYLGPGTPSPHNLTKIIRFHREHKEAENN